MIHFSKRGLSITLIRQLHGKLDISADVLIRSIRDLKVA